MVVSCSFQKWGSPQNRWLTIGKSHLEIDDLCTVYPYFDGNHRFLDAIFPYQKPFIQLLGSPLMESPRGPGRQDAPPGSPAAEILASVQRELAEAGGSAPARRQVLRRLVRRLHPDQNRGKETGAAGWGWGCNPGDVFGVFFFFKSGTGNWL